MGNQKRKAELVKQQQQRRRALVLGAIVLVAAVAGGAYLLLKDPDAEVSASPNAAEVFEGGPPTLSYADFSSGSELHSLDLTTDADELVGELAPQGDTEAAPGSTWLSVETSEETGKGKFEPVIHLFDAETQERKELGTGFDSRWSPDGELIAWNKPGAASKCGEQRCRGDISIVVTDPDTGETNAWTEPGTYSLLGWSGDYLIVQQEPPAEEPTLVSVSSTGEVQELPLRPIDYWGASPDGRWLVQSGDVYNRFLKMEDGNITGEGEEIGIREGTKLGAGAWAHDSSRVAAMAVGEGTSLNLVSFSPSDPEPAIHTEGGESSTSMLLWSPDNDGFIFQRFNGEELEAVHCPLDGECKVVLTWTTGISLLRVE